MLAHDLDHQFFAYGEAQFVEGLKGYLDHSLASDLSDAQDPCSVQMLPEEHAKRIWLGRIHRCFLDKMDPCMAGS